MKKKIKYWREMRDGVDYVYTPARQDGAVVDIHMLTYNHEPYLRHAIESVLMQETRYPYRLLIGDDCSTDRTREIIREYQAKYPDRIATILWNYNTVLTGHGCNSITLYRHCSAPYIAYLEGDDYWTSPRKLETALSFLEEHPEYIGCAHNVRIVDENESMRHIIWAYPLLEEHVFSAGSAKNRILVAHTASIVHRNYMLSWAESAWDDFHACRLYGDQKLSMTLEALGDVYFFRKIMSAYRLTFHGTSHIARTKGKNLLLYEYLGRDSMAAFLQKTYGFRLDTAQAGRAYYQQSRDFLLREFTPKNLWIFLRLYFLTDGGRKRPVGDM